MKIEGTLKGAFAVAMSIITYLFGGLDFLAEALIVVLILDYITGVLAAAHNGKLKSGIGAKGIIKKIMYMSIVALANIIDNVVGTDGLLRSASIYFFIANEGISMLENAVGMGLNVPKGIMEKLEQLRGEDEGDEDE